jgi:DNA-binding transcriptional MerR regulator
MRIGVLAEKTGVSRDTIRLYEGMGLLKNVTRPHKYNNYKEYSEENIERIKVVLTMKNLGLSLKECKNVMETIANNSFDEKYRNEFVTRKLAEIDAKIAALSSLRETLQKHLNANCDKQDIVDKLNTTE